MNKSAFSLNSLKNSKQVFLNIFIEEKLIFSNYFHFFLRDIMKNSDEIKSSWEICDNKNTVNKLDKKIWKNDIK